QKGDPVSFFVAGTGTGTLNYQWHHNGVDIPLSNSDTYSIASMVKADTGFYDCTITDDCGPVTSTQALLQFPIVNKLRTTADLSLDIFKGPKDADGCIGGTATFEVVGTPDAATYSWRKGGVPIAPPETNSVLSISPVASGDAGSYDCVVTLGSKSLTSNAATLTVHDKPTITTQPHNQNVPAGSTAHFSVTATGEGELD